MFGPMALTVVFALAGSLVCALTLMPVLASLFLKRVSEKEPRSSGWRARRMSRLLQARCSARVATAATAPSRSSREPGHRAPSWAPSSSRASTRGPSRCRSGACRASRWSSPTRSAPSPSRSSSKSSPRGDHRRLAHRPRRDRHGPDGRGDQRRVHHAEPARGLALRFKEALVAAIDDALKKPCRGPSSATRSPSSCGGRADLRRALGRGGPRLRRRSGHAQGRRRDRRVLARSPARPRPRRSRRPACRSCACGSTARRSRATGSTPRTVLDVIEAIGGKRAGTSSRDRNASTCRCASPRGARDLRRIRDLRVAAPPRAAARGSSRSLSSREIDPRGRPGADQPRPPSAGASTSRSTCAAATSPRSCRGAGPGGGRGRGARRLDRGVGRAVREPPGGVASGWAPRAAGAAPDLRAALHGVRLRGAWPRWSSSTCRWPSRAGSSALALRGYPLLHLGGGGLHRALRRRGAQRRRAGLLHRRALAKRASTPAEPPRACEAASLRADGPGHAPARPVLMTALGRPLGFVPMALATAAGAGAEVPAPAGHRWSSAGSSLRSTLLTLLVLPATASRHARGRRPCRRGPTRERDGRPVRADARPSGGAAAGRRVGLELRRLGRRPRHEPDGRWLPSLLVKPR
jgi:hypothetical protein